MRIPKGPGILLCICSVFFVGIFCAVHFGLVEPMIHVADRVKPANATVLEKTLKSNCLGQKHVKKNSYCKSGFKCLLKVNYTDEHGAWHIGTAKTPSNRFVTQKYAKKAVKQKECYRHAVGGNYTFFYDPRHTGNVYTSNNRINSYYAFYIFPGILFLGVCLFGWIFVGELLRNNRPRFVSKATVHPGSPDGVEMA